LGKYQALLVCRVVLCHRAGHRHQGCHLVREDLVGLWDLDRQAVHLCLGCHRGRVVLVGRECQVVQNLRGLMGCSRLVDLHHQVVQLGLAGLGCQVVQVGRECRAEHLCQVGLGCRVVQPDLGRLGIQGARADLVGTVCTRVVLGERKLAVVCQGSLGCRAFRVRRECRFCQTSLGDLEAQADSSCRSRLLAFC